MFPRRFFAGRYFAPRYFPQSQGQAPEVTVANPGGVFRRPGELSRVFRRGAGTQRVFRGQRG